MTSPEQSLPQMSEAQTGRMGWMMQPGIGLRAGPIPPTVPNPNQHALVLHTFNCTTIWHPAALEVQVMVVQWRVVEST